MANNQNDDLFDWDDNMSMLSDDSGFYHNKTYINIINPYPTPKFPNILNKISIINYGFQVADLH